MNTHAHYSMNLFAKWKRQNHEKRRMEREECETEITTELMFLDIVECSSDYSN